MGIILGALGGGGAAIENAGARMQQSDLDTERATTLQKQASDLETQRQITVLQAQQILPMVRASTLASGGSMEDVTNNVVNALGKINGGQSVSQAVQGMTGGAAGSSSGSAASASTPSQGSQSSPSALNLDAISQKFNIPIESLRNDLIWNEGKGIANMINERTKPQKEVVNGVLIDKNATPTGFVDGQVFTSSNGQTIQLNKGPDGSVRVSTPQGALEAQAAQAKVAAGVKTATTPIKVYNPTTKREEFTTEANVIGVKPQPGVTGNFYGNSQDAAMAIANIKDPQDRVNAQAAFEAQMRANGGTLPPAPTAEGNPAGGVAAGPSASEAATAKGAETFATTRGKNAADYENSLNEKVRQGGELNIRLQEQLQALNQFRAGGGAETRAALAQMAQAIPGMPNSVINGLAGGSLAASQEFQKLSAQTAMESLKQAMGGSGRITQAEFKVFQANNPNISMDPNAIKKISDFTTHVFSRDLAEQQAYGAFVKSGGDPGDFPSTWAQMQTKLGYTNPALRANDPSAGVPATAQASSTGWSVRIIPR